MIVVSDHGFQFRNYGFYHYALGPPGARAPGSVETLAPHGVIFLWGPPIRGGTKLTDATVFDISPTALYLLGLPVGEDMDGRVLVEALSPELLAERPVEWTPTHRHRRARRKASPKPRRRGHFERTSNPRVRVLRGHALCGDLRKTLVGTSENVWLSFLA